MKFSEQVMTVDYRETERITHDIMTQCAPITDAMTVAACVYDLTVVQLKQVLYLVTYNMPLRMAVQFALLPDEHQDLYSSMAERWPQAIKRAITEARA